MGKYGGAGGATQDSILWHKRIAYFTCRFLLQQWLRDYATLLRLCINKKQYF
jgi:hypothetical protein